MLLLLLAALQDPAPDAAWPRSGSVFILTTPDGVPADAAV